jgi:crotonobetainyl-CoA:carnitine CoA-transferase CaiB-like acyl-CoA transferase
MDDPLRELIMTTSQSSLDEFKPLAGLRVIDLTSMLAGPYCARWLSDCGAEVIKVESLDGDYMRTAGPKRSRRSAYFAHLNAGKKSVAIDLKTDAGRRIVERLVEKCDVILENFRPGVMERLGLSYESLRRINSQLIYCSISGYGQDGPGSGRPAYAAMVHAASGFDVAMMPGQRGASRPQACTVQVADVLAAVYACMAVQAALVDRLRTGRGRVIDVSLFDGMLSLLPSQFQQLQFPEAREARPTYEPLAATDGFVAVMPLTQSNFIAMCEAMSHLEWASDPRFADAAARFRNWDQLLQLMVQWTSTRSTSECESRLNEFGVPSASFRTLEEAIADPQTSHREVIHEVSDSSGPLNVVGLPFRVSGRRIAPGARVPDLGQHTSQILREILQYSPEEVRALAAAEVIG